MKHLSVSQFLEAIKDMPDIEAEQEIVMRKENAGLEISRLNAELAKFHKKSGEAIRLGYEIEVICADNSLLNVRLKEVRSRMERCKWANAVRALFGEEGWVQCREWMAAQEVAA